MSEESKERSPQKLAKSRCDYLSQAKMLTEDERTQEAAEINKALGIKAPKGSAAAMTLDTARAAYIQLLGSLGSNDICWTLSHANVRARARPTTDRPH